MATLVGGIIALILGLIGLVYWWGLFIDLLRAAIPVILIMGGALATYLGIEEWKDAQAASASDAPAPGTGDHDLEKYKAEAEKYRAELEAIKQSQTKEETGTEKEAN